MFFNPTIYFKDLDEAAAVKLLHAYPTQAFAQWGAKEWQQFGMDKLTFSVVRQADGVKLTYYLSEEQKRAKGLGGLQEDGSYELRVTRALGQPAIVAKSNQGSVSRKRQEDLVWQRLVLSITKGQGIWSNTVAGGRSDEIGTPQGIYPCPLEVKLKYIDSRQASDPLWKRY